MHCPHPEHNFIRDSWKFITCVPSPLYMIWLGHMSAQVPQALHVSSLMVIAGTILLPHFYNNYRDIASVL
jgi:hypothetical protein